jgi:hypothetical protein
VPFFKRRRHNQAGIEPVGSLPCGSQQLRPVGEDSSGKQSASKQARSQGAHADGGADGSAANVGAGSAIPIPPADPTLYPSRRKRILKGGTLLTGATRLTNLRGFVVRRNGESAYLRLAVLVRTARFHARAHDTAARVGFGDISRAADINFVVPGARCGARNTRRIVDLPKWPIFSCRAGNRASACTHIPAVQEASNWAKPHPNQRKKQRAQQRDGPVGSLFKGHNYGSFSFFNKMRFLS